MLHKFLEENREEILSSAEEKTLLLSGPLSSSVELRKGLPLFYEHLISYLKRPGIATTEDRILTGAAGHGKEMLRLNYTMSQVVHSYGAMCQAITDLAQKRNADITSSEFNDLNMCLDIAIASAVTEFEFHSMAASEDREIEHLGFLVHELRNALSSATIAHGMIKQGLVGTGGSTSRVLEENLIRMRHLIDRSLSEVRMRADPTVHIEDFNLASLVDQIILTARSEAQLKQQTIKSDIQIDIQMQSDRQLLLSGIANLTQNALKYSKIDGHILISAKSSDKNVLIQVSDDCGGLSKEAMENFYKPFVSSGFDQKGLGLGLTIVQRAVFLLQGKISVTNHPGKGCTFTLDIPKTITNAPTLRKKVAGDQALHPTPSKNNKPNS